MASDPANPRLLALRRVRRRNYDRTAFGIAYALRVLALQRQGVKPADARRIAATLWT